MQPTTVPLRTPMAASCVSQHCSQKLDRNCWFSVAEKQRTDPWHRPWLTQKPVTRAGHPKFHPICWNNLLVGSSWISEDIDEVVQTRQVGSLRIVCWQPASHQDLSSMLVVKPNGDCLAQSDAVVFVGSSRAFWAFCVGSTPMFVLFYSMSQRWDSKNNVKIKVDVESWRYFLTTWPLLHSDESETHALKPFVRSGSS